MESHLLQMRGLKHGTGFEFAYVSVASFTDAWIETGTWRKLRKGILSHLLQMRGLKLLLLP